MHMCAIKIRPYHMLQLSAVVLGFFRTGEEVKHIETTGEDTLQIELLPSLFSEAHPAKHLCRESDVFERNFRPHISLPQMAIQETFVSS